MSITFNECLDWQNSQFINIVGKDDISAVKAGRLRDIHMFLAFAAV